MALYTPEEFNAGFAFARAKINDLAGIFASRIPDNDVTLLVSGILNVAAEQRATPAPVTGEVVMSDTKGWRTLAFAVLVAVAGVVQAFDWTTIVPSGPQQGAILMAIGAAIAALRYFTTTPIGKAQ